MKFRSLAQLLFVFILLTLAIQPILQGVIPWQGDGLLHFYRIGVLERAIAAGDWYPRWVTDLGLGYGFPLFNYYAPFSYYITLPLRWLGYTLSDTTAASYILALLVMGYSSYQWGKHLWGPWGGLGSALTLLYAPYILYNLYYRGVLAELWGLAWLTATFYGLHLTFDPTRPGGRVRRALLTALAYSALILSHNITALIGSPFLALYSLGLWVSGFFQPAAPADTPHHRPVWRLWFLPFLLGIGLTTFFWLPALAERELAQIERLYNSPYFAYDNNFVALTDLLLTPQPIDPQQINPVQPMVLGWPLWGALLLSLVWLWREPHPGRRLIAGLLASSGLFAVFMVTALSLPLWEALPGLAFVLFPWRFLGPASIMLSASAGYMTQQLGQTGRGKLAGLLGLIVIALALPLLFTPPGPELPSTLSRPAIIDFEQKTGWLGTTSVGDYLPRQVQTLPTEPRYNALATSVTTNQNRATTYTFQQFYFPGWEATIDGEIVEIYPTEPYGLMEISVPAGSHELEIYFTNTPVRQTANALAIGALVIWIALWLAAPRPENPPPAPENLPGRVLGQWVVVMALLMAGKTVYLDQTSHFLRPEHLTNLSALISHPQQVNFGNQLTLLGADWADSSRSQVEVTLYWQANQPTQEYSVGLHLVKDSVRYAQSDHMHPAGFPVTRWLPGQYAQDKHLLQPPAGLPPGRYQLELFVYDRLTGQRLELLNQDGLPLGNSFLLGEINLSWDENQTNLLDLPFLTNANIIPGLTFALDPAALPTSLPVGSTLTIPVTGYRSIPNSTLEQTYFEPQLKVQLLNEQQEVLEEAVVFDPQKVRGVWPEGQLWQDQLQLFIPPLWKNEPLPSGRYTVQMVEVPKNPPAQVYFQPYTIGTIEITAPERLMNQPAVATPAEALIPELAQLVGYDLNLQANTLAITLTWQSQATTPADYTAFVQLLGENGLPLAQSDHPPTNRPTTSWIPGEFIQDQHTLTLPAELPAGEYPLIIGFYHTQTKERLLFDTGQTALELATVKKE